MSLINRMLQDLDARAGQPGAAPLPSDVRPVAPPARAWPLNRVAIAAGAAAVVTAAGFAGWRFLGPQPAPAPTSPPAASAAPLPAAPAVAAPVVAFEVPVPPRQAQPAAAPEPSPAAAMDEPPEPVAKAAAPVPVKPVKPVKPVNAAAPRIVAAPPVKPAVAKPAAAAQGGRVETPAQRADNAYRRALAGLEDGRVTEAVAGLRAALKVDPRHEAARQTLVGLLIEARRPDEAIRELGAALALDPRQPAMAMLMARLQIERGSSGIDTLQRTLPYAAGNADYHAFLAGALQRAQRPREAIGQYETALRSAPGNGVWWMGLGMSLEAEKRDLEAAVAYRRALDSETLSEPLREFVERKLRQLGR
ncbi:MAG: tetratricopeptide repeat protein [Janthinobacterium lividum]